MNIDLVFLVGTICLWWGGFQVLRSVFLLMKSFQEPQPGQVIKLRRHSAIAAASGGIALLLGSLLPLNSGRAVMSDLKVPLIWLYMPFPGWIVLAGLTMGIVSVIRSFSSLNQYERKKTLGTAGKYIFVALLGGWWFKLWGAQATLLKGVLPLSFGAAGALVILALATIALVALTGRAVAAKGLGRNVIVTAMLLVGALIFGFPFFWLLLTSVKEERDQSMAHGPVWIPQVQQTHPFYDPKNPLVQTTYEGESVKARIDSKLGEGKILVEIERPYIMRGRRFEIAESDAKPIPRDALIFGGKFENQDVTAFVTEELESGKEHLRILTPESLKGQEFEATPEQLQPIRHIAPRLENYSEALEWLPLETHHGLLFLQNTLVLVFMTVLGTILSSALVAYGFSRLRFPGRDFLFTIMLSTMMLPGAVTMMPQFLIFRSLGWIDTLLPLWVPSFFAAAFNVFLLKQFFSTIPMELEEAARIDGCGYFRTFWQVMLPQVKPALAAISIWTFMGAWNNFIGPLIYLSTPEKMPITYALQLFSGERGGNPGLVMAVSTMAILPVLLLFFFAQRYFMEGVQLSGLGGR